MNDSNVTTIQDVYAAFGRGDIPFILEQVAEDTEWSFNVGSSDVPWHDTFVGKQALPRFFSAFMDNVELKVFEPRHFIHSGNDVVAQIRLVYIVKKTGRQVSMDQLQWWTLNPDGKIAGLVHFEDTSQVIAAHTA